MVYMELMVGEMEACPCVTYIAKSNNGSMKMTNHTSWSRSCTYVEGGWMVEIEWNTPFMNLSPFYLDNMRTWQYYYNYYFFSWTFCVQSFFLGHASWACHLFSFFSIAHASIERYERERERERSLNMGFYFVDGWNMVANFQCRSLACGVWKTSH